MVRLIILFLIIFNLQSVHAQDLIPGSYIKRYGGLYKIAADESARLFANQWRDQEILWYNTGSITFGSFLRRKRRMIAQLDSWRNGSPWWTRKWFHSLKEKNGGAPRNKSITVKYGSSFKIINTPFFSVSNSFGFTWKTFQATVDFKSSNTIMFSIGNIPAPRLGWKFRVSPEFKFSTFKVLSEPSRSIRRLGIKLIATQWSNKPIISVEIQMWYNPIKRRGFVGIQLALLQW